DTVSALAYGGRKDGVANEEVLYVARGTLIAVRTTAKQTLTYRRVAEDARKVHDIVLDPDDWATAYAVDATHVYRTQDAGEHWQDITGNLSVPLLISLEVVKTNGQTVLLVGGTGGVYRAILPGVFTPTWSGLGEGLPNILVTDLHYDATNDVL